MARFKYPVIKRCLLAGGDLNLSHQIGRLFGGASPSGFAFGLRLRASPSGFAFGLRLRASPSGFAFGLRLRARPEATTRLRTHGRCPGSFPDPPQNTHGTPRSYLPRNTAVRRFGALPVAFVVLHLSRALCPTRCTRTRVVVVVVRASTLGVELGGKPIGASIDHRRPPAGSGSERNSTHAHAHTQTRDLVNSHTHTQAAHRAVCEPRVW